MIQRVQTIWLLLAAAAGFMTTQIPLYAGTLAGEEVKKFSATENLLLFALASMAGLLAVIAIFLFRNRPLQMKLTALGILVSVILIAAEVWKIDEFEKSNVLLKGTYYWGSLLPIAMIIFFILAAMSIRKDEKLIKSLNRLR